jgi:hypothetical protein
LAGGKGEHSEAGNREVLRRVEGICNHMGVKIHSFYFAATTILKGRWSDAPPRYRVP